MNSSAMPLLVDQSQTTSAADAAFNDTCLLEQYMRRPFLLNPQLQTHPYDRPPVTAPGVRLQMVPRRPATSNPVIAELMNTVAQARDRKRQREETMYPRRHFSQQTEDDEEVVPRENIGGPTISAPKRVRREEIESWPTPGEGTLFLSTGTNTSPDPHLDDPLYTRHGPMSSSGPSTSSSSEARQREIIAARQIRRARRYRQQQQETIRIQMEHQLQQVAGLVPGTDHTCDTRCPHFQHASHLHLPQSTAPPLPQTATQAHSVSPTIAPTTLLRHHPLSNPYSYYPLSTITQPSYVPLVMLPVALQAAQQHPPTIHAPVPLRPVPTPQSALQQPYNLYHFRNSLLGPAYNEYVDLLRAQSFFLPTADRFGIDRHHMFGPFDVDLPVGATKGDIDSFTVPEIYAKKDKDGDEDTCTVCLSDFEEGEGIQRLPCKHVFHPECIYKWLEINKRCPMCREEIDRNRAQTVPQPQQ